MAFGEDYWRGEDDTDNLADEIFLYFVYFYAFILPLVIFGWVCTAYGYVLFGPASGKGGGVAEDARHLKLRTNEFKKMMIERRTRMQTDDDF